MAGPQPPLLHVILLLVAGLIVGLIVGTAFMETAEHIYVHGAENHYRESHHAVRLARRFL